MVATREAQGGVDGRAERLERAIEELRRRFGEWIVYRLREARPTIGKRTVSTGSLGLDRATGIGGAPRGRVSELSGPPTSGKGTLAAHVLANAQAGGGFAALIDTDGSADLERLKASGVDMEDLLLAVPQSPWEALDIACLLAASNGLDALVISSTNGLVLGPRGDGRAFAAGLRRLPVELSGSPTAAVFLTHIDHAWSVNGNSARALAHAATLRIACTPLHPIIHASGEVLGIRLRAEVVKNKLAPPCRAAEFEILGGRGIHAAREAFELGQAAGLVSAGPLGFSYGDTWLGKGREQAVRTLDHDSALRSRLQSALGAEGS